jgi:hypothetical protein
MTTIYPAAGEPGDAAGCAPGRTWAREHSGARSHGRGPHEEREMDDDAVLGRIGDLVEEEHRLRDRIAADEGVADEERDRLAQVERQLDQCWDLLRQRRAREEFGADPDGASARPEDTVERYRQ